MPQISFSAAHLPPPFFPDEAVNRPHGNRHVQMIHRVHDAEALGQVLIFIAFIRILSFAEGFWGIIRENCVRNASVSLPEC